MAWFDFDQGNDRPASRLTIDEVARSSSTSGRKLKIERVGHADRTSGETCNMGPCVRHTAAVTATRVDLGMPTQDIGIAGNEESMPVTPTTDGVHGPSNRWAAFALQPDSR